MTAGFSKLNCSRIPLWFGMIFILLGCGSTDTVTQEESEVDRIVNASVAFHGGDIYHNAQISFSLRDRLYTVDRQGGLYQYTSAHSDSLGLHLRKLTNEGYSERLDARDVLLSPKDSVARAGSVNSVVYFALLPGLLEDPSARKTLEGTDEIGGQTYHRIRVQFVEEGGGTHYDDAYLYWIDPEDFSMDYLAYSFLVDGGGTRFRKAYNARRINGLMFQDYENYKGPTSPDSLEFIAQLYNQQKLSLLSNIELRRLLVMPYEP